MSNLTFYERQKIEYLLRCRLKVRAIARLVARDHSVVSREIRRNKSPYFPYSAIVAQKAAERKAKRTNCHKLDKDEELLDFVSRHLRDGWSPEQIAGRLKIQPPAQLKDRHLSYESIYRYIYDEKGDGQWLYHYLRRKRPVRQKKYARKRRKITIPERVSIHLRPAAINLKTKYGHWESDAMVCKNRRALSVQYERKSQLLRVRQLANLRAETTQQAITESIDTLSLYLWQSITFDNGPENAQHTQIRDDFGLETYFTDAYCAWQKGGVENIIGLLREYLPKRADLAKLTDDDVKNIQERLNNRPRKSLNYFTPNEIIEQIQNGALNS